MTGPDPGFSIGGHGPILGGFDLQRGHFSVKMYAKMKELGPVGGACASTPPLDLPMYEPNGYSHTGFRYQQYPYTMLFCLCKC